MANIRFSRTSYVVYEKSEICIDVINELEPTDERFSVSYNFGKFLLHGQCMQNTFIPNKTCALYMEFGIYLYNSIVSQEAYIHVSIWQG